MNLHETDDALQKLTGKVQIRRQSRHLSLSIWLACFLFLATVLLPLPAQAHTGTVAVSSNERSRILTDTHPLPGVTVRLHPLAKRITLSNTSDTTLVVLGYTGEPFLRVGPDGVFQNQSSPSCTAPNANPLHPDAPELRQDPVWKRLSTSTTAQWHDHRVHWVTKPLPESVQNAPDKPHVLIERWAIPLAVPASPDVSSSSAEVQSVALGSPTQVTLATIQGDARWIPNDNPWPLLASAVVAAILGFFVCRMRVGRWLCVAALGIAGIVSGLGLRGDALTPLISAALGGILLVAEALRRQFFQAGSFLVLACASVLTFVAGLGVLEVLWQPVLVTTWPTLLLRLTVVAALGLGPALIAATVRELREQIRR